VEGLPLGTQGGMVVRHTFPVDAEYQIQAGGGGRVDITIDGTPIPAGRGRIPIPAGPRTIRVATVAGFDTARMDGIFSVPAGRGRGMSVTITGPFRPSNAERRLPGMFFAGSGTTAAFTNGVLASHAVTISNTGSFTITATRTSGGSLARESARARAAAATTTSSRRSAGRRRPAWASEQASSG
jgi:hypothetical protein